MTCSKHDDEPTQPRRQKEPGAGRSRELGRDPGINTSKGVFGRGTDPLVLQADSTDEGDILNDTTREGAVDPGQRGRSNNRGAIMEQPNQSPSRSARTVHTGRPPRDGNRVTVTADGNARRC